jgi:hypothetical protein
MFYLTMERGMAIEFIDVWRRRAAAASRRARSPR